MTIQEKIWSGHKSSDVGAIPKDWEFGQIGEFIDLLTGFPFPSSGYSRNGVRLLRGSNVKRGMIDWSEEITKRWPRIDSAIRRYELAHGDIVVAMDGALVGRSFAAISPSDLPALLLQRVARIRSSRIAVGYLKEWVCSDRFALHCDSLKTNTAIPHISPADIRAFPIAFPPSQAEQRAIAAALSDADELIASLDALIAKKRDIKQAAMQQLLTGKTRLPGFEIESGYKETEIGEIPQDWDLARIVDIASITTGSKNTQDRIDDGTFPFFVRSQTVERINSYSFDGEAVLTAGDGVGTGKIFHYINGKFDFHQRVYKISGFSDRLVGYYFYIYFSNKFYGRIMAMTAKSSVDSVRREMIADMLVPLPRDAEQRAIAAVLSDMEAELTLLEAKRDKVGAIKQGMMQELLTGRTRLI